MRCYKYLDKDDTNLDLLVRDSDYAYDLTNNRQMKETKLKEGGATAAPWLQVMRIHLAKCTSPQQYTNRAYRGSAR